MIAAETLLIFSTRGEKKKKLAHAMLGFASIANHDREKYFASIIEVYSDRSSLVHSGSQDTSKYTLSRIDSSKKSHSLSLLNKMMLSILTEFPKWYFEIEKETTPDKYLVKWHERIRRYIPVERYNSIQKLIIKIINWLKKIGKINFD